MTLLANAASKRLSCAALLSSVNWDKGSSRVILKSGSKSLQLCSVWLLGKWTRECRKIASRKQESFRLTRVNSFGARFNYSGRMANRIDRVVPGFETLLL
ncbi:hypothetical protein L6164_017318 [Bauhinia variegata]|uniref:Uncharacterized protein n=1 Tax=Bauhinia variegata TaxID=167791 RepID=A0ACB9N7R7_BAUVA|nr:hypothetical protein L6164_017318 [Bauhinia variegata]